MDNAVKISLHENLFTLYEKPGYITFLVKSIKHMPDDALFYDAIDTIAIASLSQDDFLTERHAREIDYWKSVYKQMNLPRKKGFSSFESLYKRFSKNRQLPRINPFVDLYNAISLKHSVCIGAYNADTIQEKLYLAVVEQDSTMLPIGADKPLEIPKGSVAYFDSTGIVCAYWNYRDSDRTCVSDNTKNIIVTIDIGTDTEQAVNAAKELVSHIKEFFDCTVTEPVTINADTMNSNLK